MVNTMTGKAYGQDDFVSKGCGMGYEATMYLLERGIKVTGTDAELGHPYDQTAGGMQRLGMLASSGRVTRQVGTSDTAIEKLHNLEELPATGSTVSCFHKIR